MISTLVSGLSKFIPLFSTVRFWVSVVTISAAVASVAYLVNDYSARGVQIEKLKTEVTNVKKTLEAERANLRLARNTVTELNQRVEERSGSIEKICKAYMANELKVDPDSLECVGPTIGDTLKNLQDTEKSETKKP